MPAASPVLRDLWVDPQDVFAALIRESPDAQIFWLDAGPDADAGWSWIGTGSSASAGEVRDVVVSRSPVGDAPAGRVRGGWVGWVGYEAGASAATAPVAVDHAPHQAWLRIERLISFDHASHRVWSVLGDMPEVGGAASFASVGSATPRVSRARVSAADYADQVRACREAIRRGDAYQLCLTTRFEVDGAVDPLAAHDALRRATPSHHGALLRFGATSLVSATPERFLEAVDGVLRTHPIKGTRPRGVTAEEDARLVAELRDDPKERAENVMIVDLMRNDLARVCDPATVTVERLLEVESYPAVHQLVSTIAGRVTPGTTVGHVLDAVFPAGSMTGAPKLSAMTILHGLERAPRGAFAGCFGWVGDDGELDLAMTIRTIVVHPAGAYIGAGGGITWGSVPEAEVDEVALKAAAPLAAIGATLPPDWVSGRPLT